MLNLIEKFKRVRIEKASISFMGMSFDIGLEQSKQIAVGHLKELYIIRNVLSRFYFLHQNRYNHLLYSDIEEFVVDNELTIGLHKDAVNTYHNLSNVLLGSEYFMLLNEKQRNEIIESFDYVYATETYLEASDDNDLSEEEIAPITEGLVTLFDQVDKKIKDLEAILDSRN